MKNVVMAVLAFIGLNAFSAHAENVFDHSQWDTLLNDHIVLIQGGQASQVDYQGFADQRAVLKGYLDSLEQVSKKDFDAWSKGNQLAFLINAYNAWTVELILTKWPNLDSIKDLGSLFRSPWSKAFVPLFGGTHSLDDIEHKMIRGSDRYQDPRIHFAVNCASIGCPALANEAYQEDNLESLLEKQTMLFLADRTRNYAKGSDIHLSSIFKWYREDFEKGWKGYESLESFLFAYKDSLSLSEDQMTRLKEKAVNIRFLSYDWALNKVP